MSRQRTRRRVSSRRFRLLPICESCAHRFASGPEQAKKRFSCIGLQGDGATVPRILDLAFCSSMQHQVPDFSAFICTPDVLKIALMVLMGDTNVLPDARAPAG